MPKYAKILCMVLAGSILFTGCSIGFNTKVKNIRISTELFGGDIHKMKLSILRLQAGAGKLTKEDIFKEGWDCTAPNVQRFRGPSAMPFIVGDIKNNVDLSSSEKIEDFALAIGAYEVCKFPEYNIKSKKDRWYFSENKGKTTGTEISFVITFKNGILLNAREDTARYRSEPESEKSFGGNILEQMINFGISAGKKF